jgi:hypothetical protein
LDGNVDVLITDISAGGGAAVEIAATMRKRNSKQQLFLIHLGASWSIWDAARIHYFWGQIGQTWSAHQPAFSGGILVE